MKKKTHPVHKYSVTFVTKVGAITFADLEKKNIRIINV